MRFERSRLVFMGLVALDEIREHCIHQPWHRAFTLRATLAMLYAFSDGDRTPFDLFWQACAMPHGEGEGAYQRRLMRSSDVNRAYSGICRALGVAQTIAFCSDIALARRDPGPHMRAYSDQQRAMQSADEAARQRFAEMLRVTAKETAEEKERQRLARECPLRG